MAISSGSKVKFVSISKSAYDALATKDTSTVYFVKDTDDNKIYVDEVPYVGDSDVFLAVFNVTTHAELFAAVSANKSVLLRMPQNSRLYSVTPSATTDTADVFLELPVNIPQSGESRFSKMVVRVTVDSVWTFTQYDYYAQPVLESGTNIKTINNQSILGGGNLNVEPDLSNYYTESETDALLSGKADIADVPTRTSELTNDGDGTHNFVTFGNVATETSYGVVKINPSEGVNLNENGQLTVYSVFGEFEGTSGVYTPNTREPRAVGDYSMLITDAKGVDMTANRAYALVTGLGVTCRSAAAGSTQYRIKNTYANRILAKLCENGHASRDEATSKLERVVPVVSVQIGGAAYTPDSSADQSSTASDIIITTSETLNPDSAITSIRLFGKMTCYATAHIGNGIASWGGGRNFMLGGGLIKDGNGNDNCIVCNGAYVNGNGNAVFGRNHVVRKNRGFIAGQGHDTTNASGEGVSAIGSYSYIDANTMFAVGGGTDHVTRLNLFEVTQDGGIVLRSPNGTRYKITVSNTGAISARAV